MKFLGFSLKGFYINFAIKKNEAQEKMFYISCHQGMEMRNHYTPNRKSKIQTTDHPRCW